MKGREDIVDRTLRGMTENPNGAYIAKYPPGHPKAGYHCTNSGTCILVCCYINALGKVLLKGGPPKRKGIRRDLMRFSEFRRLCMSDCLSESSTRGLPPTPNGKSGGDGWLYEVYRCGFIHGFYPSANVAWGRNPNVKKYWFKQKSQLVLNIDELVRGFQRGLLEFQRHVSADADLRSRFTEYIIAN
jgi:hypothetical protein